MEDKKKIDTKKIDAKETGSIEKKKSSFKKKKKIKKNIETVFGFVMSKCNCVVFCWKERI